MKGQKKKRRHTSDPPPYPSPDSDDEQKAKQKQKHSIGAFMPIVAIVINHELLCFTIYEMFIVFITHELNMNELNMNKILNIITVKPCNPQFYENHKRKKSPSHHKTQHSL